MARRSHVRASVRARLARLQAESLGAPPPGAGAVAGAGAVVVAGGGGGGCSLAARRQLAGIPALSLFGAPHLDYFEEDDGDDVSEGATAAVAARPTSSILSAYRQVYLLLYLLFAQNIYRATNFGIPCKQ